jgi:hypothetical protein
MRSTRITSSKSSKTFDTVGYSGLLRRCRLSVAGLCVALAACGGGGGSGGSGAEPTIVSTTDPITSPRPPANALSSEETAASRGAVQIGADIAYAAGATGRGVKVAVIDSGISMAHPEFAGRIDRQNSIDIVTGTSATLEDESGHGSHVAGIIAANANGVGMRGVAPEATLLAIRADLRDSSVCSTPGCGYFDSDVAAALDHARAQRVDIVNLSIGKDSSLNSAYRSALEKIIASGSLVVVAAGNQSDDQPLSPGRLANASGIEGGMLVAGAVDRNGAAYDANNKAGSVAPFFLVAPGVDVYSTFRDSGYQRLTGTSMATPHVAGAAAVVKSAFPSLSMQQVASILLATADDLGPSGVDQTFGRGLVNLERALQPVGRQQVALGADVDGPRVSLKSSELTLGSAFGDALSAQSSLSRTMVLDAYDRPFVANLQRSVRRRGGQPVGLDHKLRDQKHYRDVRLEGLAPFGFDGGIAFSDTAGFPIDGSTHAAFAGRSSRNEQQFERFSFAAIQLPSDVGSVDLGVGLTASEVGASPHSDRIANLFVDARSLIAPTDAIVDRGTGGNLRLALTDQTMIKFGYLDSTSDVTPVPENGLPGRVFTLGTEHRFGEQAHLDLSYAYVEESEGLLGSEASGAFAFGTGTASQFGTARLNYRPIVGLELFAQATLGVSQIDGESSLLNDWSTIRSDAFALGLISTNVVSDGDRFGVMVGQPLRVDEASATLDLPTARTIDGAIERSKERIKMTPSGREIRLEIAYLRPIGVDRTLGAWLLFQHQPGHDAHAEPATGIGMRYTSRF